MTPEQEEELRRRLAPFGATVIVIHDEVVVSVPDEHRAEAERVTSEFVYSTFLRPAGCR